MKIIFFSIPVSFYITKERKENLHKTDASVFQKADARVRKEFPQSRCLPLVAPGAGRGWWWQVLKGATLIFTQTPDRGPLLKNLAGNVEGEEFKASIWTFWKLPDAFCFSMFWFFSGYFKVSIPLGRWFIIIGTLYNSIFAKCFAVIFLSLLCAMPSLSCHYNWFWGRWRFLSQEKEDTVSDMRYFLRLYLCFAFACLPLISFPVATCHLLFLCSFSDLCSVFPHLRPQIPQRPLVGSHMPGWVTLSPLGSEWSRTWYGVGMSSLLRGFEHWSYQLHLELHLWGS